MEAADPCSRCLLGELPDELLLAIVCQLDISRGFLSDPELEEKRQARNTSIIRSLRALTLTCAKLAAITTPFLYKSFVQGRKNLGATRRLFRTLIQKPRLAQCLQYFENSTTEAFRRETERYRLEQDMEELIYFLSTATWRDIACHIPFHHTSETFVTSKEWRTYIRDALTTKREHDPLQFATCVIASIAENLSEVAVYDHERFATALGFRSPPTNGGLKTLWIKIDKWQGRGICKFESKPTRECDPLRDLLRIGYSTDLLRTYAENLHNPSIGGVNILPSIDAIQMEIYDLNMRNLCRSLVCCRSLSSFKCRWVSQLPPDTSHDRHVLPRSEIKLPYLRKYLGVFTTSLESLTIDTLDSGWLVDMDVDIPAFGSLREFTALKHLDVSGLVLFGDCSDIDDSPLQLASMLPKSLETLKIQIEWDDDIEDALLTLLPDCTKMLPSLKIIDCTWRTAPKIIAEYLKAAFKDIGVQLLLSTEEDKE